MGDGIRIVREQGRFPRLRPERVAHFPDEVPEDKGPQADLDRVVHALPREIDVGSCFPEPAYDPFDLRPELLPAEGPPRIPDESRRAEGNRQDGDGPADGSEKLPGQLTDVRGSGFGTELPEVDS